MVGQITRLPFYLYLANEFLNITHTSPTYVAALISFRRLGQLENLSPSK